MRSISHASAFALAALAVTASARAGSTINTTHRWAWSAGAGWVNCRTDSTNGAVIGQSYCSGWWYSPGAGWIHLGDGTPSDLVHYSNADSSDYGVNHDGEGHLTGYAWCESSGWVNFEWTNAESASAPKVNLNTGYISGYAWGGSLGWISLSNLSAKLKTDWLDAGSDSANSNGIPDAWELSETGATNLLGGGTNNYDNDGMTDYEEYVAGSCPTNPSDFLGFTGESFDSGATNLTLTWSSEETRLYKVETNANLVSGAWSNCLSGYVSPSNGGATSVSFSIGSFSQLFYRVRAVLPLGP